MLFCGVLGDRKIDRYKHRLFMELSLEIVLGHVLYVMFEWSLVKGGSQASFDLPCWRWLMVESVGDTTRNVKFWFWIGGNHVRGSATNQDWNGI